MTPYSKASPPQHCSLSSTRLILGSFFSYIVGTFDLLPETPASVFLLFRGANKLVGMPDSPQPDRKRGSHTGMLTPCTQAPGNRHH